MARIKCACGQILSNSNNPEIEHLVFSDKEWIDLMSQNISDPLDIDTPKLHFWKCSSCGRIYLFSSKSDSPISVYKIEKGRIDWEEDT